MIEMFMNRQCFEITGVTEKDYLDWCKEKKKSPYRTSSKREFFARINDGRLVKDKDGKLIRKYKRKK